jgi:hypothetical protein
VCICRVDGVGQREEGQPHASEPGATSAAGDAVNNVGLLSTPAPM